MRIYDTDWTVHTITFHYAPPSLLYIKTDNNNFWIIFFTVQSWAKTDMRKHPYCSISINMPMPIKETNMKWSGKALILLKVWIQINYVNKYAIRFHTWWMYKPGALNY